MHVFASPPLSYTQEHHGLSIEAAASIERSGLGRKNLKVHRFNQI